MSRCSSGPVWFRHVQIQYRTLWCRQVQVKLRPQCVDRSPQYSTGLCSVFKSRSSMATVVQTRSGAAHTPVLWCRHLQEQHRPLQCRHVHLQLRFLWCIDTSIGAAHATVVQTRPGAVHTPVLQCRAKQASLVQTYPSATQISAVWTPQQEQHMLLLSRHVQVQLRSLYCTVKKLTKQFYTCIW